MAAAKTVKVMVKPCVVNGVHAYGITDGNRWFFYAYATPEDAERCIVRAEFRTNEMARRVNIVQDKPYRFFLSTKA